MNYRIIGASSYQNNHLEEDLSSLIKDCFREKFSSYFFSKEIEEKLTNLISVYLCTKERERLLVAIENDQLLGCLYFRDKKISDNYFRELLKQEFKLISRLRIYLFFMLLSYKPKNEEIYIDFLAVFPKFRGEGIGQKLLETLQSFSKEVTLHVASDNYVARSLYQKQGFNIKNKKKNVITKWISRAPKFYFMEWRK